MYANLLRHIDLQVISTQINWYRFGLYVLTIYKFVVKEPSYCTVVEVQKYIINDI